MDARPVERIPSLKILTPLLPQWVDDRQCPLEGERVPKVTDGRTSRYYGRNPDIAEGLVVWDDLSSPEWEGEDCATEGVDAVPEDVEGQDIAVIGYLDNRKCCYHS
jgi:hypothetical protein